MTWLDCTRFSTVDAILEHDFHIVIRVSLDNFNNISKTSSSTDLANEIKYRYFQYASYTRGLCRDSSFALEENLDIEMTEFGWLQENKTEFSVGLSKSDSKPRNECSKSIKTVTAKIQSSILFQTKFFWVSIR